LGSALYGENDTTLEAATVALLKNKRATVATAESCTGGLLGGRLTEVAGSSEVYGVGLVTYSNEAKQNLLQIPHALIAQMGAVSSEVAQAMAERVREISGATYGIGITGIAGPGGGTEQKPVGLVYVALSGPSGTKVERNLFTGIRADIRLRSTQKALDLLRLELLAQ
jgi:nicotinamide-nucleotide amidase